MRTQFRRFGALLMVGFYLAGQPAWAKNKDAEALDNDFFAEYEASESAQPAVEKEDTAAKAVSGTPKSASSEAKKIDDVLAELKDLGSSLEEKPESVPEEKPESILEEKPVEDSAPAPAPEKKEETKPDAGHNDNVAAEGYVLQAGDRVSIKIYPTDEYIKNTETEITPDGNITLPLVGKISIVGKTAVSAGQEIARVLDKDYIVNPEVVVEVLQYTEESISVLGEVKRPGTYKYPLGGKKMTLIQAISMAGGFSDIANIKKIKIMRRGNGKNETMQANAESIMNGDDPDPDLEPEDVVSVPESLF